MNYFKQSLVFLVLSSLFLSCDLLKDELSSLVDEQTVRDSWIRSGGRNHLSFKNIHYTFELSKKREISVEFTSDIDGYLYIIDELEFKTVETSRNEFSEELEAGIYELVVGTYTPNETGFFELVIHGTNTLKKISSTYTEIIGSWTSSGGRNPNSYRNRHYMLNVPQNTYLDLMLESECDGYLYLIDDLGFITSTTADLEKQVTAGTYEVVVATYSPDKPETGESPNYKLEIFGHFGTPSLLPSIELTKEGTWVSSGGRDMNSDDNPVFTFEVTQKSFVDVLVLQPTSTRVDEYLYLLYPNGDVQSTTSNHLFFELEAGIYRLIAGTYQAGETGNFIVELYGSHIQNLLQVD